MGADYLLWWVKDGPAAGPLITSGSALDTFPGVIGQPGTAVLFGNQPLDFGTFSGLRVNAGAWLDPEAQVGVEGRGFFLAQRSVNFTAASDGVGAPVLARPVINAITGAETAFLVSFPATAVGTVSAEAATRLWGAEANALANLARNETWVVEGLVGFRYLNLRERLQVGSSFTPLVGPGPFTFLGAPVPAGSRLTEFDRFDTQNHFWGGQVGGRVSWARDALNVGVRGTVALGCTDQTVTTSGASSLTNGTTTTATGGIQAVSSNIGQRWSNSFSVVPEVGLDLGWQLASWAQVRVGYSFLYWSGVVRPGEQVDRQVNPGLVPTDQDFGIPGGPVRPASQFNRTDFWAHGLNFGAELTF